MIVIVVTLFVGYPGAFNAPLGPAQEAWEIITHFDKVIDPRRLNELLMSMGIMSAEGLVRRHPGEVQAIAQTLKPVPRRRFLQLFGLPNF